jgi:hypothetical protein
LNLGVFIIESGFLMAGRYLEPSSRELKAKLRQMQVAGSSVINE